VAASVESKLFNLLLRLINKKKYLGNQLASGKPSFFDCPEPTTKVKKTCQIARSQLNGRNVFTLTPKYTSKGNRHIIYLHGGAYVQCFNAFHWKFLAKLVERTGCTITAPDYPLAPTHSYKDAFSMVSELYRQIIETIDPGELIIMGDSSGGGFALAVAQKMRNENLPQPDRIILLSPWLDAALKNPGIAELERRDPFLEKQGLQAAATLYADGTDTSHYLLSPIHGSLNGLGRISVFIGTNEILLADTRKLKESADANGITVDYYEYEDMVHGWMFLHFPESMKARKQIIELVNHPAQH
jgi:epsilon-lactone hydrolase